MNDAHHLAKVSKAATGRRARADLEQRLASGVEGLASVLTAAETDPTLGKMRTSELLAALPRDCDTSVRAIMNQLAIAPTRRLANLTRTQRAALLRRYGAGPG